MNIDKNKEKIKCQKYQRSRWSIGLTHNFKLGRPEYKKKENFELVNEIIFFIHQ